MVYVTQTWLNRTYGNDSRFERIPVEDENVKGRTGWTTIYALTRAFQIELGITQTADNFGPTTVARFNERWPNGIQPAGPDEEDNVYAIIQGAMWCKGYSSGHYADDGTLDRHFDDLVAAHIMELKMDAGLSAPDGVVTLNVMKALLSMDYFVIGAGTGGDEGIRSIQQALNRDYEDYIGLRPCDGIYGRGTNEALIYALQKEEGLDIDTANGYFGPTTKRLCPTLPDTAGVIDASTELRLIRLLQYSLYCNGFKNYGILGVFNSTTEQAIKNFQTHYALERNGIADLTTWMSLLTSCGNPDRPAKACDCATILTAEKAATLKNAGYEVVGRYLSGTVVGGASKALSREEIQIIFDAGLRFFPIYQGGAYYAEYFTEEQGRKDAYYAYSYATQLGIPANTIIYFAVDYDAMDYEVTQRIIPYFRAVHEGMQNWNKYRVGIYGARNICTRVSKKGYAVSSFVGDMSTGFSGNLGFTIPDNWAFDQFTTVTVGSGAGEIEIDKDGYSGRDTGVTFITEEKTVDIEELERIDRSTLMNTHYYADYYNANHTGLAQMQIPSEFNDYNILACLQLLFIYFWDKEDYEKTDMLYQEMITLRKLHPSYRTIYADFVDAGGQFDMGYQYYAPHRRTTMNVFVTATYFTKDTIKQMHEVQDWTVFMVSLIPKWGTIASVVLDQVYKTEQGEELGLSDLIIEGGLDALDDFRLDKLLEMLHLSKNARTAISTLIDFSQTALQTGAEDRETYVKDGVTLQDGDSYINVRLFYDMGIEQHDFQFYFRNGYPIVTNLEQFVSRWDNDPKGVSVSRQNAELFAAQGYVPSEYHQARGQYWDDATDGLI